MIDGVSSINLRLKHGGISWLWSLLVIGLGPFTALKFIGDGWISWWLSTLGFLGVILISISMCVWCYFDLGCYLIFLEHFQEHNLTLKKKIFSLKVFYIKKYFTTKQLGFKFIFLSFPYIFIEYINFNNHSFCNCNYWKKGWMRKWII